MLIIRAIGRNCIDTQLNVSQSQLACVFLSACQARSHVPHVFVGSAPLQKCGAHVGRIRTSISPRSIFRKSSFWQPTEPFNANANKHNNQCKPSFSYLNKIQFVNFRLQHQHIRPASHPFGPSAHLVQTNFDNNTTKESKFVKEFRHVQIWRKYK